MTVRDILVRKFKEKSFLLGFLMYSGVSKSVQQLNSSYFVKQEVDIPLVKITEGLTNNVASTLDYSYLTQHHYSELNTRRIGSAVDSGFNLDHLAIVCSFDTFYSKVSQNDYFLPTNLSQSPLLNTYGRSGGVGYYGHWRGVPVYPIAASGDMLVFLNKQKTQVKHFDVKYSVESVTNGNIETGSNHILTCFVDIEIVSY